jgi:glycosyltransferase involved in cell wall biosynthesis
MTEKSPILSIIIPTYNHENYIVKALDSVFMQKCDYDFEILVGEDCSTDNTRAVLKEYEQNHPDKRLKVFYRESNMSKLPVGNSLDLKMRCKGKYIIALEGDDFWTDDRKLQKQIDFLENNPEYIAVAHNCVVVGEDNEPNGEEYPECKDTEYTFSHFFKRIMPGQYTTFMTRNYMTDEKIDRSLINAKLSPGDQLVYFSLLCYGKVYCMQETMSAYRHIVKGGSSYSANVTFDYDSECKWYSSVADYAKKHCEKSVINSAEAMYVSVAVKGIKERQVSALKAYKDCNVLSHRNKAIFMWCLRVFKRIFCK